jgi:hypothetical protein
MEYVFVNGARIEKSYLDGNIAEARSYRWTQDSGADIAGHDHCIICGKTIVPGDSCYSSANGRLCPYCFEAFVSGKQGQ